MDKHRTKNIWLGRKCITCTHKPLIALLITDGSSDEELISSIPKKKIKQIRIQRTVTVLEDLNRKGDEKIK